MGRTPGWHRHTQTIASLFAAAANTGNREGQSVNARVRGKAEALPGAIPTRRHEARNILLSGRLGKPIVGELARRGLGS
jgi:hypothetical protein